MIVWIYTIFTTDQMRYKCVSTCESIPTYTFAPHLNSSKLSCSVFVLRGDVIEVAYSNCMLVHYIDAALGKNVL